MPTCMSIQMSVHMSAHMSTHMSTRMSIQMPVHMSICMSIQMPVHMSICMSTQMPIHNVYAYLYTCLHACLYTCLHTCLYTCLHTCLYTCLYAYPSQGLPERARVDTMVAEGEDVHVPPLGRAEHVPGSFSKATLDAPEGTAPIMTFSMQPEGPSACPGMPRHAPACPVGDRRWHAPKGESALECVSVCRRSA